MAAAITQKFLDTALGADRSSCRLRKERRERLLVGRPLLGIGFALPILNTPAWAHLYWPG